MDEINHQLERLEATEMDILQEVENRAVLRNQKKGAIQLRREEEDWAVSDKRAQEDKALQQKEEAEDAVHKEELEKNYLEQDELRSRQRALLLGKMFPSIQFSDSSGSPKNSSNAVPSRKRSRYGRPITPKKNQEKTAISSKSTKDSSTGKGLKRKRGNQLAAQDKTRDKDETTTSDLAKSAKNSAAVGKDFQGNDYYMRAVARDICKRPLFLRPSDGKLVFLECFVPECGETEFRTVHGFLLHFSRKHVEDGKRYRFESKEHALESCGIESQNVQEDISAPMAGDGSISQVEHEEALFPPSLDFLTSWPFATNEESALGMDGRKRNTEESETHGQKKHRTASCPI